MKRFTFLFVGSISVAILMGSSYIMNVSRETALSKVDTLENSGALEEEISNTVQQNVVEYEANLKCIGDNLFNFSPLALSEVCLENKSTKPINWTIKAENEEVPSITGTLKAGEKTPPEIYLLEKGSYQLSLDGDRESEIDFQVQVKQCNQ